MVSSLFTDVAVELLLALAVFVLPEREFPALAGADLEPAFLVLVVLVDFAIIKMIYNEYLPY
jgi:hypothetical protein